MTINDFLGGNSSPAPQVQQQSQQPQGLPTSLDDPRMKSTIDYVNSHGGNAREAFYRLCQEKMLNPAEIINKFIF